MSAIPTTIPPPVDLSWVADWAAQTRKLINQVAKMTGWGQYFDDTLRRLKTAEAAARESGLTRSSRTEAVMAIGRQNVSDVAKNVFLRRTPEQYILDLLEEQETYYTKEMKWFGTVWKVDVAKELTLLGRKAKGLYALLGADKGVVKQDIPKNVLERWCKSMQQDINRIMNPLLQYTRAPWDRTSSSERIHRCIQAISKVYNQLEGQQQHPLAPALNKTWQHLYSQKKNIQDHDVPGEALPFLQRLLSGLQDIQNILNQIQAAHAAKNSPSVLQLTNQFQQKFASIKPELIDGITETISRQFNDVTAFHDALRHDREELAELFKKDQKTAGGIQSPKSEAQHGNLDEI